MGALMTPKAKILFTLALSLVPLAAQAAPTAGVNHGTVMVSAERLFGLSFGRVTTSVGNVDTSRDTTNFSLLYSSASTVHMTPRVAIDFVPIDGLTVGGAIGFAVGSRSDSASNNNNTVDADGPTTTAFVLSPRVGYVLGLSSLAKLWLRGGFTYFWQNTDFPNSPDSSRLTGLSLDLEPTLLLSVFEHLGFTAGLLVNLPLTGSTTNETVMGGTTRSTSIDTTIRNIGLVVGMVGSF
jgi:hypothetical protein